MLQIYKKYDYLQTIANIYFKLLLISLQLTIYFYEKATI